MPSVGGPPSSDEPIASRLEFETLISGLSSRFINLAPAETDDMIDDALRRVSESLGIDYAVLWQWSGATPDVLVPTHAYPVRQASTAPAPLRHEQYPWVLGQIRAGSMVLLSSLDELPEQGAVDRESARLSGIKANLTIPLTAGGRASAPWRSTACALSASGRRRS